MPKLLTSEQLMQQPRFNKPTKTITIPMFDFVRIQVCLTDRIMSLKTALENKELGVVAYRKLKRDLDLTEGNLNALCGKVSA